MTKLGIKPETGSDDKILNGVGFVQNKNSTEISLEKAVVISTVGHPVVVGLIWLIFKILVFILAILGITLPLFNKPAPKVKDIEFVLVNKEQTPINKHTKYRSDRNSRAGGKHDPRKAVSLPEPKSAQSKPRPSASPAPAPKQIFKKIMKQVTQPKQHRAVTPSPTPPAPPSPQPKASAPKPSIPVPRHFNVPVPPSRGIKAPRVATPGSGSHSSRSSSSSSSSSNSGPSSSSPVMGTGSGSSHSYSRRSGSSSGSGSAGNPGPGNPNGDDGIDAMKEADFGPYMTELKRRIKRNWEPPRGNESKRVVVMFVVGKDGRLISQRIMRSSGNKETDRAAMSAVELTAPFKPLPPEYRGKDVDIQFTFDYNVLGARMD